MRLRPAGVVWGGSEGGEVFGGRFVVEVEGVGSFFGVGGGGGAVFEVVFVAVAVEGKAGGGLFVWGDVAFYTVPEEECGGEEVGAVETGDGEGDYIVECCVGADVD